MRRGHFQRVRPILKRKSPGASHHGYAALQQILREFASALLPRGMTPKLFGELARVAFVQAAAEKSLFRNGRVNQSRVAAQTGVPRAEVKRLLNLDFLDQTVDQAPVQRVLNGWRKDRRFTDNKGAPKKLRFSGRRPAFKQLVEKYAGDIPYRAILDELNDMGTVSLNASSVELRRAHLLRRKNDFSFLSPLTAPFSDGLGIVTAPAKVAATSLIQRLSLPVATEVDMAIIKDRCIERATTMLEGLSHSINERVTLPTRRKSAEHAFTVTVLLAEGHAKRARRPRNRRGEKS